MCKERRYAYVCAVHSIHAFTHRSQSVERKDCCNRIEPGFAFVCVPDTVTDSISGIVFTYSKENDSISQLWSCMIIFDIHHFIVAYTSCANEKMC